MKHLFLDLEDTVITPVLNGWFNTQIINSAKVKRLIAGFQPDKFHLFSFAIHGDEELKRFHLGTRPMIEKHFGFEFSTCWSTDDIIRMACLEMRMSPSTVDFADVCAFWSKHETFRLCARRHLASELEDNDVMLLDDVVLNETFHWPDLGIRGQIINIDTVQ